VSHPLCVTTNHVLLGGGEWHFSVKETLRAKQLEGYFVKKLSAFIYFK